MMNSLLSGQWLPLFINTVVQSLFVLAAAAMGLTCARKASAARRHLIAAAALGVLLLIPIVSLLLPAPKPLLQVSGEGPGLRRSPARVLSAPVRIERVRVPADRSNLAAQANLSPAPVSVAAPASLGVIVSAEAAPSVTTPPVASGALVRFVPCLAALWLMGVFLVLGRLWIGFHRVRWIARLSDAALSEPLQRQLKTMLADVGFAQPLTIIQASRQHPVSVPMTWGVRPATLLLPADAGEWPAERLRVVVLHELTHILRHDWLTQLFGQIVCALYWFHPLVWMLHRHTQIEAESACDDAVLRAGVRAKEYASHLLDVVKAMQSGREAPSAAVAMARPRQVRSRLQSILNAQRSRQVATRPVRTLILSVTALLLCAVSLLRPLAWAKTHPQATDRNPIKSIGQVVDLPNGISVELVGVGAAWNGWGDDWWTPDGKPLFDLPDTGTEATRFANADGTTFAGRLYRTLFFRLYVTHPGDKPVEYGSSGYVAASGKDLQNSQERYSNSRKLYSALLPTKASVGEFTVGFSPTEARGTYRFGVASGSWETITATRFSLTPMPDTLSLPPTAKDTQIVLNATPHISYKDSAGAEQTLSLLGGHTSLGEVASRVVALDKDGKEVPLGFVSEDFDGRRMSFPPTTQARIVELRLQTCPYQWAEFKDIVLKSPVATPHPIPTPPTLPAFRHTFACGITLTAAAVTENRKEGGLWWKPDGTSLAGPLKEFQQRVAFRHWKPGTHPRAVLLQLTSPRTVSYTVATRFTPPVPNEFEDMPLSSEGTIVKNMPSTSEAYGDFTSSLSRTTLRYGIAAGPWKTVAVIPMPTDVRHASETGVPEGGGLEMQIPGSPIRGDLPNLRYTNAAGKNAEIPFQVFDQTYLSDVARRFVAVDKAGRVFPLHSTNGSLLALDKDGKTIPKDPANVGKPDLLVGDYLRREVETVELTFDRTSRITDDRGIDLKNIRELRLEVCPYEWATFPNIALQPAKRPTGR